MNTKRKNADNQLWIINFLSQTFVNMFQNGFDSTFYDVILKIYKVFLTSKNALFDI